MKLLLDTHVLLWGLGEEDKIGPHARRVITNPDNEVLVSVASLWEIVIKIRVGKLVGEFARIRDAAARSGFVRLPVEDAHLSVLATLPLHHRDPFDHLLLAQAIQERTTLVSDDHAMAMYPVTLMSASGK